MTVKPLRDVLDAIEQAAPIESRASLSRWMRRHHDDLLARIGERPDWGALAEVFADAGLLDRTGKPASPATVRLAWARVRKSVAAARAKHPLHTPTPSARAGPGPVPPPPIVRTADPQPADEEPRHQFRISRPRQVRDDEFGK